MKNLDERHIALLNSAFYMVQPPQTSVRRDAKVLSPLEAYVKDLLVYRLGTKDTTTTFVSKQLLRCPWSDVHLDCGALITKYLLKACRKGRYKSISTVASLIANLKRTKPEILSRVTDMVLEELQYAMENPSMRDQQRSIVYAKLLGEMHCQALVSGSIIFDQLYNLVNFDHNIPKALHAVSNNDQNISSKVLGGPLTVTGVINEDEEMEEDDLQVEPHKTEQEPIAVSKHSKFDPRVPSILDKDTTVFRVKLICILLDSSSPSLVTTGITSKLEKFMAAFQRYLFVKSNLPADIEFSILDSFDIIDSKMKGMKKDSKKNILSLRFKTWLEAHNSVVATEELDALSEERSRKRLLTQAGLKVLDLDSANDGEVCDDLDGSVDDESSLNSHDNESLEHGSLNSFVDESEDSDDDVLSLEDVSEEEDADEIDDESEEDDDETFDHDIMDEAAAQEDYMKKLEDEAFERELRKLTMEALERGKNTARTVASAKVSDTMPSASQFARKKAFEQGTTNSENDTVALGGEAGMTFKLIKRGHKGRVESKEIIVPSATNLAKAAVKQDDEAAKERDMLKARVLQYEAESADQAFNNGDVYMDQTRLPEVRNRQVLTMEDIDRNFGTSSFNRRGQGGRGSRNRTLWRS
jgi:regulator of nonsense transcripts 2